MSACGCFITVGPPSARPRRICIEWKHAGQDECYARAAKCLQRWSHWMETFAEGLDEGLEKESREVSQVMTDKNVVSDQRRAAHTQQTARDEYSRRTSFSQGWSIESAKVVSNQRRRRQRNAPSEDSGGL